MLLPLHIACHPCISFHIYTASANQRSVGSYLDGTWQGAEQWQHMDDYVSTLRIRRSQLHASETPLDTDSNWQTLQATSQGGAGGLLATVDGTLDQVRRNLLSA